jgi:hypothetical protein
MTLTIKHATLSNVPDEGVPGEIGPSEWNESHAITGVANGMFLVGDGTGGVSPSAILGEHLPTPTTVDRGGIFDIAAVAKKWVKSIISGQPALTQPTTSDLLCSSTNDSAAAGELGEYKSSSSTSATATVTISQASPAVVSWTGHGLNIGSAVNFTTTGALPSGLSVGTTYYVSAQGFGANSFSVSTSVDNALAGTSVNTSSAGSGTYTAISQAIFASATDVNITGLSLTAGDWDVSGNVVFAIGATTTVSNIQASISTVSATRDADLSQRSQRVYTNTTLASLTPSCGVGPWRVSLSATGTIYLVARSIFAVDSVISGYGKIIARRTR